MQSVPLAKKDAHRRCQMERCRCRRRTCCEGVGLAGNHNRFHAVAGMRRAIGCHPDVLYTDAVGEPSLTVFFWKTESRFGLEEYIYMEKSIAASEFSLSDGLAVLFCAFDSKESRVKRQWQKTKM